MSDSLKKTSAGMRLRRYFLTGLIVVAPLAITAWLTWTFVLWVDGWVKPYLPKAYNPDSYLPFGVPGYGLLVALVALTIVGFLTASLVGRTVLGFGESLLNRMPLVRVVYRGLKQIFETVLAEQNNSFKRAALIEYPRKGLWSIVFVATETRGEVDARMPQQETISVFLPTTPNPTSGFLLFVPRSDVIFLDMSVEEAAKMVISAGLVAPEYPKKMPAETPGAPAAPALAKDTPPRNDLTGT
ncbi:DUF502 domain-containing protein [Pseudohoeflea coraliihabitans]|uniref:DUF502 domain-containing protein n=1 Tax=Pseudohoeflea coraliihabitans TaxID=2860393 RepID=A0ABS6WRY6_9HYPH|nr:DUF502 domain-containing protein [Pseudohoeflea sp. DP4N28-3]MBW3098418.1 DUF502 domain-containing protein [Pseudohoeflea sp. DP4N28-3]